VNGRLADGREETGKSLKVCLEISASRQSPRSVDESDIGEAVE